MQPDGYTGANASLHQWRGAVAPSAQRVIDVMERRHDHMHPLEEEEATASQYGGWAAEIRSIVVRWCFGCPVLKKRRDRGVERHRGAADQTG